MFLDSLKQDDFHGEIPQLPSGKYAHIIVVRETNSFPLFQTDGELNTAYVSAGRSEANQRQISRIVMFKRKQTTAERLHGRELLRASGITTIEESRRPKDKDKQANTTAPYFCEYNSANFCKVCPDCTYYGYAIGNQGSERSKVLSDSAYSLTPFDIAHQTLTFNAPYESGTMSQGTEVASRFGEQDHVLPQTFFPAVITIKDPTEAEFLYVLNNVLHTRRYGAQTTRTGTVMNYLVGVAFTNGEIFSNLRLTQAIYDDADLQAEAAQMGTPLEPSKVMKAANRIVPQLLNEDGVVVSNYVEGATLLEQMNALTRDEQRLREMLNRAAQECVTYATRFGVNRGRPKPNNKPATDET